MVVSLVKELIQHFQLVPLPDEGGLFVQTYQSPEMISQTALPTRYRGDKPFGTAILYLLTDDPDSFSALHQLPTDEVYHFYLGDPVEMLLLFPDQTSQRIVLGPDVLNGQHIQHIVPNGVWQGSYLMPGGAYALLGTTMAPGFDHHDYTPGERQELLQAFPQEAALIRRLTR